MCGRASYSARTVNIAAHSLGASHSGSAGGCRTCATTDISAKKQQLAVHSVPIQLDQITGNSNMSPGHTSHVFRRHPSSYQLECTPMTWGLLPQHGTQCSPHHLPSDSRFSSSPHYNMFNARSETLYEKRSFGGLIRNGQTCIFAVDGYYEWTASNTPTDKRKQPYYICRKDNGPMFLAGLWSCVRTGRHEETITTFTILTTDAHPTLSWLHPRQPVILWGVVTALKWMLQPSSSLLESIRSVPSESKTALETKLSPWETQLVVYPVTKKMSNPQYHGDDCTTEVKLGSSPSVKSFFATKAAPQIKSDGMQSPQKIDFDSTGAGEETKGMNEARNKKHDITEASKCPDIKRESVATPAICTCPQAKLTRVIRPTKHLNVDIHHGLFASKNLPPTDPNNWYNNLLTKVRWHRVKYKSKRFQKDCETPCYTAFYGGRSEYKPYIPIPEWFAPLIDKVTTHLKENNKEAVPIRFNAFLLRLYFDGNDEIAWHTDGRTFLGDEPTIASLSLGNKATFQLRRMNNVWPCADGSTSTEGCIDTNTPIESFVLQDGDLLVMRGKTQQYWHHRVPKEKGRGVRLNINFRYILPGIDSERGQMTYYKYMVYGDVPVDCEPPNWSYDEILKKKGRMMNFVKGGGKRKAAEDSSDPNPEKNPKTKADPRVTSASLHSIEPVTNSLSDTQQFMASDQGIDPTVFDELPIDIQNELVSQWKLNHTDNSQSLQHDTKATVKKKPKQGSGRGTLDSFFKKK